MYLFSFLGQEKREKKGYLSAINSNYLSYFLSETRTYACIWKATYDNESRRKKNADLFSSNDEETFKYLNIQQNIKNKNFQTIGKRNYEIFSEE